MGDTLEEWFDTNKLLLEIGRWLAKNWEDLDYGYCRVCGGEWEHFPPVEENGRVVAIGRRMAHKPDCLITRLLAVRPDLFMEETK